MANISLTNTCNSSCSYCFGLNFKPNERQGTIFMQADLFRLTLDFLVRSGINQARLLGGEPTLHPDFPQMIRAILERKMHLVLFTNGRMSASVLQLLEQLSPDQLTVILNTSVGEHSDIGIYEPREEILKRLNDRIIPGFTIQRRRQNLLFLAEWIQKYHLQKKVRLGLAHPLNGGVNTWLHPKFYRDVGEDIFNFCAVACKNGIKVEFDCGFVPCMFPQEIFQTSGIRFEDISLRCSPIPDILPDGTIISCYPLSQAGIQRFSAFSDIHQLKKHFSDLLLPYKKTGIYRQCSSCELFIREECLGGCKAASLLRMRSENPGYKNRLLNDNKVSGKEKHTPSGTMITLTNKAEIRLPEKDSPKWIIPYIDQPDPFWNTIRKRYSAEFFEVYFPLPENIVSSGRPAQEVKHLDAFLEGNFFRKNVIINPLIINPPVERAADMIIDKLKEWERKCGIDGITLSGITLAGKIKKEFPGIPLTASVLMDISSPGQIPQLENLFDTIVVASRIVRDKRKLEILRENFSGKIRLIVNEGCLPGCVYRTQHFYEMGLSRYTGSTSLCEPLLRKQPWLRLTGAWVLPQHLHLYDGLYDELKLSGRVTLSDPDKYLHVLDCYVNRIGMYPDEIGGGPAALNEHIVITEAFFNKTLTCNKDCSRCEVCHDYWMQAQSV